MTAPADLGYWTGSIAYTPQPSTPAAPITISVGTGPDSDGIAWVWNKLDGWDGPDIVSGSVPQAGDHGAWASPQFYQPRVLTWTVTASAATQALRDLARAKLSMACPVSDLATLTWNEPVPLWAAVRRAGKITETCPTLFDVQFSVPLTAPDPRKYTVAQTVLGPSVTGGATTGITFPLTFPLTFPAALPPATFACTNGGSFETRPLITVQGPVTGPALVNTVTGQAVTWSSLTLGSGDTLVVDFNARLAFLNGTYRPADPPSWWWVLPPQATTPVQLQADSNTGATVTVSFYPAFI